jgi:hypothetical protein
MAFETYLIEAANVMKLRLNQAEAHPEQAEDNLGEASVIGCDTLRRLSEDENFRQTLERMVETRTRIGQDFRIVTDDLAHFEFFLGVERDLLVRGGLSEELADELIQECRNVLENVKRRQAAPREILDSVYSIRDRTCELSASLVQRRREAIEREREARERAQTTRMLRRAVMVIGGAAIVGINVSALAATLGVSAVGSAVSQALGSGIIGAAIPQ